MDSSREATLARIRQFQIHQPRELIDETAVLRQKVLKMNAKPMIRINPILTIADRLTKALEPYTACKRGCNHCCHIQVAITGVEAQLLGSKIGVPPAKLAPPKLRPQSSFSYETPCTFLKDGECGIYEHRPFACRNHASFESTDEPCKLTNSDGSPRSGAEVITPDFPELKDALNAVVNLVGKTEYADIRDYFPRGRAG